MKVLFTTKDLLFTITLTQKQWSGKSDRAESNIIYFDILDRFLTNPRMNANFVKMNPCKCWEQDTLFNFEFTLINT